MYKLLIVDDEILVRIGIKNCINWREIGFDIPFEASNGKEALQIMQNQSIDVVLTDIKMPGMDGIEMIKTISLEPMHPEVIILSCFNEFEYVREAMRYGVRDFLFKPKMFPADIVDALKKAIEYAEGRKSFIDKIDKLQKKVNEDKSWVKENFLLELIGGKKIENSEFLTSAVELEIHITTKNFIAILFTVNNFDVVCREKFICEQYRLKAFIQETIEDSMLDNEKYEIVCKNLNEYILLNSGFDTQSESRTYALSIEQGKKIIKRLKDKAGLNVSGGISKIYNDAKLFYNAYNDSAFAAKKSEMKGDGNISLFDERHGQQIFRQTDMMEILNDVFNLEGYAYVKNVESIFTKLKHLNAISMDNVKEIGVNIVNQLLRNYVNYPQILNEIYKKFPDAYLGIYNLHSLTGVESYITELARQLEGIITNHMRRDIVKTIEYIKKNIHDPELSLERIASQNNISKNYFSRLFKETMGENFTDYLIKMRLEHATELYMTSDLKVYEIAEKVGYPNWRYFTKLYKKKTGKQLTSIKLKYKL